MGYFTTVLSNNYYTYASFQVQLLAQFLFGSTDGSTCLHEAAEIIFATVCQLNDSFLFKTHNLSQSSEAHVAFALSRHLLKQNKPFGNYDWKKQLY